MQLLAEGSEENIAVFEVLNRGDTADIFRSGRVVFILRLHHMILILDNHTEVGINMGVILAVIFMAGRGDKNRVQVQNLDTQVLQVIEFIDDSLEVAAVEAAEIRIGRQSIPIRHMLGMADGIVILVVHNIIGRIAVEETVRENLILYGTLGPGGHMEAGNETEGIVRAEVRMMRIHNAGAELVIRDGSTADRLNQETVNNLILVGDQLRLVVIKKII